MIRAERFAEHPQYAPSAESTTPRTGSGIVHPRNITQASLARPGHGVRGPFGLWESADVSLDVRCVEVVDWVEKPPWSGCLHSAASGSLIEAAELATKQQSRRATLLLGPGPEEAPTVRRAGDCFFWAEQPHRRRRLAAGSRQLRAPDQSGRRLLTHAKHSPPHSSARDAIGIRAHSASGPKRCWPRPWPRALQALGCSPWRARLATTGRRPSP